VQEFYLMGLRRTDGKERRGELGRREERSFETARPTRWYSISEGKPTGDCQNVKSL